MTNLRKIERALANGTLRLKANSFSLCALSPRKQTKSIRFRIRANKTELVISTGVKMPVNPDDFDRKAMTIKGDALGSRKLQSLRDACFQAFTERDILGKIIDARTIYGIAVGRRGHEVDGPGMSEVLDSYLALYEKMYAANNITKSTFKRYTRYSTLLKEFFKKHLKTDRIEDLKPAIQYDLILFLKGEKQLSHNYALKFFSFLKSTMTYAVANEWADRNVLQHIRLRKYKKDPIVLSDEQLKAVQKLELTDPSAILVRDIFLAQCYTGFAYADISELTSSHFFYFQGVKCLLKPRIKNRDKGISAFVPVFPDAMAIFDKYAKDKRCLLSGALLPAISNQKANKWLKIIGISAGIKEVMTTHIGRKTFTRYVEDMGFTLNEMATMMGHTTATMTEHHYYSRRREPIIIKFKQIFGNRQIDGNQSEDKAA